MRDKLKKRRDRKVFSTTAKKRNVRNYGAVKRGGNTF